METGSEEVETGIREVNEGSVDSFRNRETKIPELSDVIIRIN